VSGTGEVDHASCCDSKHSPAFHCCVLPLPIFHGALKRRAFWRKGRFRNFFAEFRAHADAAVSTVQADPQMERSADHGLIALSDAKKGPRHSGLDSGRAHTAARSRPRRGWLHFWRQEARPAEQAAVPVQVGLKFEARGRMTTDDGDRADPRAAHQTPRCQESPQWARSDWQCVANAVDRIAKRSGQFGTEDRCFSIPSKCRCDAAMSRQCARGPEYCMCDASLARMLAQDPRAGVLPPAGHCHCRMILLTPFEHHVR
jgi:hypothetical protein